MGEFERWKLIGERVKRLIHQKGYKSVELFAHEHAIHKSVLSRVINGKREIRLSTFLKIAEALEMSLDELALPGWASSDSSPYKGKPEETKLEKRPSKFEKGSRKQAALSTIEHGIAKLVLSEIVRIEIRRNEKDKPLVILDVKETHDKGRLTKRMGILY